MRQFPSKDEVYRIAMRQNETKRILAQVEELWEILEDAVVEAANMGLWSIQREFCRVDFPALSEKHWLEIGTELRQLGYIVKLENIRQSWDLKVIVIWGGEYPNQ